MLKTLIILCAVVLSGCYSEQKARQQFSRASVAYPEILAKTCSDKYPVRDSIIKGDSVVTFDTLYVGETHFDTTYSFHRDTTYIVKTLPGKTIFQNIWTTDTVYLTNHAALDLCEIERRAAVLAQKNLTDERDSWKGRAKKRFYIMWGLGLLIVIYIAWRIYKAFYLKK